MMIRIKSFKVATWLLSLSSTPMSLIAPIVETSKTGEIFLPTGDFFEWRNVPLDYIFNLEKFVTWMLSDVYFLFPYIWEAEVCGRGKILSGALCVGDVLVVGVFIFLADVSEIWTIIVCRQATERPHSTITQHTGSLSYISWTKHQN